MSEVERLARQATAMAEANTILRKIAAHVPARVWIEAKEKAGFGTEVKVSQLSDPAIDEAWLKFVAAGPTQREESLEQALRHLLVDVDAFDKSGTFRSLRSYCVAKELSGDGRAHDGLPEVNQT